MSQYPINTATYFSRSGGGPSENNGLQNLGEQFQSDEEEDDADGGGDREPLSAASRQTAVVAPATSSSTVRGEQYFQGFSFYLRA